MKISAAGCHPLSRGQSASQSRPWPVAGRCSHCVLPSRRTPRLGLSTSSLFSRSAVQHSCRGVSAAQGRNGDAHSARKIFSTGAGFHLLLFTGLPTRGQICSSALGRASTSGRAEPEQVLDQITQDLGPAGQRSQARLRRLSLLCVLRKLYRNMLRAEGLLRQASPICQPPDRSNGVPRHPHAYHPKRKGPVQESEMNEEAKDRREAAVEVVAEMKITAEQLKSELRAVRAGFKRFGEVLGSADTSEQTEQNVIQRVRDFTSRLDARVNDEISHLPFPSRAAAVAAIDARNARKAGGKVTGSTSGEESRAVATSLEAAEKAVNKFVSKRLQPAVKKVRGTPLRRWAAGVRTGADYVGGLWSRLNGATSAGTPSWATLSGGPLQDLPWPRVDAEARASAISKVSQSIDSLDKKLIEASKLREGKVRKAGMADRARLAAEMRDMDVEVAELSRALAVRTLQLQMEYVAASLEDEALDIVQNTSQAGYILLRLGSSDELALLVADFGFIDVQLAEMCDGIDSAQPIDGDDLSRLAVEVPDLRDRLGIGEATVFAGSGWTWVRVTGSFRDSYGKIVDGVQFFARGLRLLGSDVSQAGKLFTSAALGASLKPREVLALRRTAQDVLAFIPFAIILIAPLTPVGHVLIFGFIQRYFPGFFPSQFSSRRQELVSRYEELRSQLRTAQEAAQAEDEEAELARATAAVARLTAPSSMRLEPLAAGAVVSQMQGEGRGSSDGPAARAMRSLERQVAAAEAKALQSIDNDNEDID